MITRRVFVGTLAAGLVAAPLAAEAQPPGKVYRLGVVLEGGPYFAEIDGLRDGLKELGFDEGKQYLLHIRDVKGDLAAVAESVKNFERERVDLIHTVTTSVSIEVQRDVAGRALGVRLQLVEARGPGDLERAFSDMTRARADALTVHSTPMFASERRRLADLAAKHRLPTVFAFRQYVDAGGLMSYGPDLPDLFRRAATYVDKILKGAKPADLPVEQPTKFELIINLKTAKAPGLTIPQSVLGRADEVIQ